MLLQTCVMNLEMGDALTLQQPHILLAVAMHRTSFGADGLLPLQSCKDSRAQSKTQWIEDSGLSITEQLKPIRKSVNIPREKPEEWRHAVIKSVREARERRTG